MNVDLLIKNAHLFTMRGSGVGYLSQGAIAIEGKYITAVGTSAELIGIQAEKEIDARGKVVMPGLIDAHMHTPLALLRGVAQDVNNWMQAALAPFSKHLDKQAMLAGTRLNVLEALKFGTTTFGDYWWHSDAWAQVFMDYGVRACLTPMINALPETGMAGLKLGELYPLNEKLGNARLDSALIFAQEWKGKAEGRLNVFLGPQGPDMLTREQILRVKKLADKENLKIHMHLAQGSREIDQVVKRYGKRSIEFLHELGFLDEQLLAVHLTVATDKEVELLVKQGSSMILCSGSIGIIDGIVPPAKYFKELGGRVALGSDQASGNNLNNMFNEMKLTALFNKIKYQDPEVMPAWEVLRMATIESAKALGLDHEIGSLDVGKLADLIIVNLNTPNLAPIIDEPVRNIVPNLVYSATGKEVETVLVNGKTLVDKGECLSIDESAVLAHAQEQANRVVTKVKADPLTQDLRLVRAMVDGYL